MVQSESQKLLQCVIFFLLSKVVDLALLFNTLWIIETDFLRPVSLYSKSSNNVKRGKKNNKQKQMLPGLKKISIYHLWNFFTS